MVRELQTNKIWQILERIPDPEVPIISIVELGIIRDVSYKENQLNISITPTYSGCPAMYFIKEEITSYDLGPGNCVIDQWVNKNTNSFFIRLF